MKATPMKTPRVMVSEAAWRHNLDSVLVAAIVSIESSWDPWAWNPEPHYRYLWDVRAKQPFRSLTVEETRSQNPPRDFYDLRGFRGADADQEWWGQQASWGLMQVMGAVARERGFTGIFLPQTCAPEINLDLGCAHLAIFMRWAGGDTTKAVAGYNAGRGGWNGAAGQAYAAKVLTAIRNDTRNA